MKNMLLLTTAMALTACAETVYNASPSIFPPITGTQVLPTRAGGYYQGRPDEFIRQLSDADQVIWDGLTGEQRIEVARYLRAGGTVASALRDEQIFPGPDTRSGS